MSRKFALSLLTTAIICAACVPAVQVSDASCVETAPAPRTATVTISPVEPDGLNDWYATEPTVTITPSASFSIEYYVKTGSATTGTFQAYSAPFTLPQGVHRIVYHEKNATTTLSDVTSPEIRVDTQAPQTPTSDITPASPDGENDWYITAPQIELACTRGASDIANSTIYYDLGASSGLPVEYTDPIVVNGNGEWTVRYYAVDEAGHRTPPGSQYETRSFKYDNATPDCAIALSPSEPNGLGGIYTSAPVVYLSAESSDVDDFMFNWTTGPAPAKSAYRSLNAAGGSIDVPEGERTIYSYSVDNAGRESPVVKMDVYLDTTIPSATISVDIEPQENGWYMDVPKASLSSDDPSAKLYFNWQSTGAYSEYTGPIEVPEGNNTLRYFAIDDAHAQVEATISQKTFLVDATGPTCAVDTAIDTGVAGEPFTVNASKSTDNIDFLEYRYKFGDGAVQDWSGSHEGVHIYNESGTYRITVDVRDRFRTSDPASLTITITGGDDNTTPEEGEGDKNDTTNHKVPDPSGKTFKDDRYSNIVDSDDDGVPDWYETEVIHTNSSKKDVTDAQWTQYIAEFNINIEGDESDEPADNSMIYIGGAVGAAVVVVILLVIFLLMRKKLDAEENADVKITDPNMRDPNRQAPSPSGYAQTSPMAHSGQAQPAQGRPPQQGYAQTRPMAPSGPMTQPVQGRPPQQGYAQTRPMAQSGPMTQPVQGRPPQLR